MSITLSWWHLLWLVAVACYAAIGVVAVFMLHVTNSLGSGMAAAFGYSEPRISKMLAVLTFLFWPVYAIGLGVFLIVDFFRSEA